MDFSKPFKGNTKLLNSLQKKSLGRIFAPSKNPDEDCNRSGKKHDLVIDLCRF